MSLKDRIEARPDTKVTSFKARTFRVHPESDNEHIYGLFDPENNEEDASLVDSIRTVGLIQPITVRPHPTLADEYIIVSGHRRLAAHAHLKMSHVPVTVIQPETEEELLQLRAGLVQTNTNTRTRTNAIMAREIDFLKPVMKRLKEIDPIKYAGVSVREMIAEKMAVSEKTVQRIQTVLNQSTPETKEAFQSGEVSLRKATKETKKNTETKSAENEQEEMNLRQIPLVAEIPDKEEQKESRPTVSADTLHHHHNQILKAIESVQELVLDNPELVLDETFQKAVISMKNVAINYIKQKGD